MAGKGKPKTGGRKKGSVNKSTALLKDAILHAAERAGDKDGMVGYLTTLAKEHPAMLERLSQRVAIMPLCARRCFN